MNTFQLLKSGASFSNKKVEKVKKLFTKEEESQKINKLKDREEDEDDKLIKEIESSITTNKEKTKQASVKESEALQTELKKLMNRRNDAMSKLRKKYKVVVEGAGSDTVSEIIPSFIQMAKKLELSPGFSRGIEQFGYTKPTPVQM